MATHDGKPVKKRNRKWQEGKLCPKCSKGKLMACNCKYCKGHRKHLLICTTCKRSNY